jgi:two-component system, OmpR family, phosphate regulon sensor histidine kinase PhoR
LDFGVREKLFTVSVGMIAIVGLIASTFLETQLRDWLVDQLETRLQDQTAAGRELLLSSGPSSNPDHRQAAISLGSVFSSRMTFFDEAGLILGDSALSRQDIASVDTLKGRPELVDALATGHGSSMRYSPSSKTHMILVATPYFRGGKIEIVRAALPMRSVDEAISRLRYLMALAALLGLAVALIMSGLASYFFSRALTQLMLSARAISRGKHQARIESTGSGEIGSIARSINRMSDEIENLVSSLTQDREQFESVLEGMREGVIAVDGNLRVTLVNASARELLILPESARGRPLVELVRVPALMDLVMQANQHETLDAEFTLEGPPQKIFAAHMNRRPLSDEIIIVLHDITKLRHLETMRRDFVANVSHELRTPVSVIRGNADNLLDGALEDPQIARQFVSTILRNSDRMTHLIKDLLDLAKIEAGVLKLEPTNVLVHDIAQRSADFLRSRINNNDVRFEIDIPESLEVMVDASALEQILTNYLENAVKYASDPGLIRVWYDSTREYPRICVEDNGSGIAPEHRARLFERFYRVDSGRSRNVGGTGLGLAIVKHLAHAMRGQVGMEPAIEQGAIFWVELPPIQDQGTDTIAQ